MEIIISIAKWLGVFLALAAAIRLVTSVLNELPDTEAKRTNYKNISIMAGNLVNSKVSTRKEVLSDLYKDPEWTEEEVDELKSVIEGMLNTKIFLDRDNRDKKEGLKEL